ncbi:MAG: CBS domain-containing protein [Archaeoglobaceae archaeon]|nr:CBS domain-containing protein [Archaeoglobaceae archaeon]
MDVEGLKELIRENYYVISVNETISKVLSMLEAEHDKAILAEEDGKIVGVVREKDLIRGGLMTNPDETKIKNFLVRTGVIPLNELKSEKVVRRFIEDSTPFVLIKLNGKIGVIHIDDYIQKIKHEFENVKVSELMSSEVVAVRTHDTAAKALATMRDDGISRVVVVDDESKVAGIITGKDIIDRVVFLGKNDRLGYLSRKEKEKTLSIMIEGVMSRPVVTVERNDTVAKVIDLMIENEISSVVVTKNNSISEGIVVKKDILEYCLKKEIPTDVQIITKGVVLDDLDVERLLDDLNKFMEQFKESFGKSHLFVYIKKLKMYYRRVPLIYVRMRLTSDLGVFFVTGESWGVEFTIHATLKKLERQVLKDKEVLEDKRMVQRFYEEVF